MGLIAGSLLSCSSTVGERTDASQSVSTSDASSDVAIVDIPDAAIVDAEIDICSSLPGSCLSPMPTDAAADAPVVDPNRCPPLATYCPQHANGNSLESSTPTCDLVETWPEAAAYTCTHNYAPARYLNCNGSNAIVFGSVEFSTVFYFDSTTLALVAIADGPPYGAALGSSTLRCVAGSSIPQVDPATCQSVTSGRCVDGGLDAASPG